MNIQRRANNGELPNELLSLIFIHLNNKDILRCSLVCRDFRDIIGKDSRLQYPIALKKHGFVDGPHGSRAIGECLRLLLDQQARWRALSWFGATNTVVPSAETLAYSNGMLVQRIKNTVAKTQHDTVFVYYMPNRTDMKLYCAPLNLKFSVVAATVDLARDLLALAELHPPDDPDADEGLWVRIHLIRIFQGYSNWTPHPDAHDPAEQIDFYERTSPLRYYSKVFTLRIAGTRLMLNIGDGIAFSSLYVWDWTTGPLIFERTPEETWSMQDSDDLPDSLQLNTDLEGNEPGQWCFGDMLSPDAFITAQYIQTYTSDEQPHREEVFCGIDVFRIGQEARHPRVLHLITLMLPVPVRDFTIKPNIVAGSCSPQPDPRTPFSCDPSSRIIVIDLGDLESSIAPCIVVPQSILIALAEKYDAEDERMKIPWEEWGLQNTRVIETVRSGHSPRAVQAIHGMRGVFTIVDAAGPDRTCILDFNIHPSLEGVHNDTPSRTRLVTEPSIVYSQYFKEPITSCLPYYETFLGPLDHPERICGLDEQRVVCLQAKDGTEDLDFVTVVLL